MPWKDVSLMNQRKELVLLALSEGVNRRELARRAGIAPKTLYKWLERYQELGEPGLQDVCRRPHHSPQRTRSELEQRVLELRDAHPAWGGRKLAQRLKTQGEIDVPSPSTITAILHRHGRIESAVSQQHQAWQRFEHPEPNQLWQMDFKGHVANERGRCHPLTILDDHSRFSLCLAACDNEQSSTVQQRLIEAFRRYGLPRRMTMDNGSPWGGDENGSTALTVWLMRLGIAVSHSRPYHPQTQGKDERFHRTLKAEVLQSRRFIDNTHAQAEFDRWRQVYNTERPHEALGLATPITRYRPSPVAYQEQLPALEYQEGDRVYKVDASARIEVKGRRYKIGKAFIGQHIALRPSAEDGVCSLWFSRFRIGEIDLRDKIIAQVECVTYVPEHL